MRSNRQPVIKSLPKTLDVENWVDEIINPARADSEAKRLIDLIFAVADEENPDKFELALNAAIRAYLTTAHFEESFKDFAGLPAGNSYALIVSVQKIGGEQ